MDANNFSLFYVVGLKRRPGLVKAWPHTLHVLLQQTKAGTRV